MELQGFMATAIKETYKAIEVDAETGEVIERDLTSDELAERLIMQSAASNRQTELDAKIAARESALAKLADLGLTAEEIAAL